MGFGISFGIGFFGLLSLIGIIIQVVKPIKPANLKDYVEKPSMWLQSTPCLIGSSLGLFCVIGSLGIGKIWGENSIYSITEAIGFIFFVLGFGIATWATKTMKNHLSEIAILKDHKLVTSGAFAYSRHPIYLAILLLWIGAGLALGNIFLLILFPITVYIQIRRALVEEKLLIKHFGNEFIAYKKQTPMLVGIPHVQ